MTLLARSRLLCLPSVLRLNFRVTTILALNRIRDVVLILFSRTAYLPLSSNAFWYFCFKNPTACKVFV